MTSEQTRDFGRESLPRAALILFPLTAACSIVFAPRE